MPRSGFAKVRLTAARRADDLGHFPQDASLCVAVRGEAWTLDRWEYARSNTALLPFQPEAMSPAQLAAVSYRARYSAHTHTLYAYQLRRWFGWCETNGIDPLVGIQSAHVELYIRHLAESGPA